MGRIEFLPHNLIKIDPKGFLSENEIPDWVIDSLEKTPLVIVRRGEIIDNKVPVGVRGVKREQRFAGFILIDSVIDVLTPQSLVNNSWDKLSEDRFELPAIKALDQVSKILKDYNFGIGGSVGFELASGQATAKMTSDLDLIWYESTRLSHEEAFKLLKKLNQFGVHADFQVVHGQKGFSLEEFVNSSSDTILVKTANGPILSNDPWSEIEKD
ncbi:malonate decarboxylase holo-ACP synthase [Companilactobacillus allii]|uniref:Phosphoribosyl-dephospho-CoA transferase n=1 Tax=Companilactobacillus allii TaxID=1847728 RepID=A0A1P8Q3B9_9LACO|nr:malonate decarboxylase holo-ACP synthase [Companilactobacillus allii]APX72343.1 phosphoribosyl-dephospho-CoA transferase [Companilactobacillus allii]USQ69435.1 malonate decarboxylase holo-ACP synthase [Companilactobacillus allii]